jgi:hypothetical protein
MPPNMRMRAKSVNGRFLAGRSINTQGLRLLAYGSESRALPKTSSCGNESLAFRAAHFQKPLYYYLYFPNNNLRMSGAHRLKYKKEKDEKQIQA